MFRCVVSLALMLIACNVTALGAGLVFTPIPLPAGCVSSTGMKINAQGNAAFNAICIGKQRSFFYFPARPLPAALVELALPFGAIGSVAHDINDNNVIVGASIFNANGAKRYPTVWSSSGAANLYPEPTSTDAFGINPSARPPSWVVGQTDVKGVKP